MKKSNFTEQQIFKILESQNQGKTVEQICREQSISNGTFYRWKSKYSGMEAASELEQGSVNKVENRSGIYCTCVH